jgi:hypothetical protein
MIKFVVMVCLIIVPGLIPGLMLGAFAQHDQHGAHAQPGPAMPYAGQDARDIKSLSAEDIAELRRGGGWGFAKSAELNGMPGPAHLLELKTAGSARFGGMAQESDPHDCDRPI